MTIAFDLTSYKISSYLKESLFVKYLIKMSGILEKYLATVVSADGRYSCQEYIIGV